MATRTSGYSTRLFYSYCHKDEAQRQKMEDALTLLKRNTLLRDWSDHKILPGEPIPEAVRTAMNAADIIVFLFSQHFIASQECMNEWDYAKHLSKERQLLFRIPIIVTECAWLDVLRNDFVKALPNDGKSVRSFRDRGVAWQQVYNGLKDVVSTLRNTFLPKSEFIRNLEKTEFISNETVNLRDIFVFPTLLTPGARINPTTEFRRNIVTEETLCKRVTTFIHGEDVSGKTALARHLYFMFLDKADSKYAPLLVDFHDTESSNPERILAFAYEAQYTGDFGLWKAKDGKVLILENMSPTRRCTNFLRFARDHFEKIFVTLSSDIYHSFFLDDERFADFSGVKIEPLNHSQQETLIRNMLSLSHPDAPVPDGLVDQFENSVNSIIISNKIVPRYPFYVLSILQTKEKFMPDVSITSYGHCYYVLIVAHLLKSGISAKDMDINACFNFLENLAFAQYSIGVDSMTEGSGQTAFEEFIASYTEKFFISSSMINRLTHQEFGIVGIGGTFRHKYMYHYFLGRFFANNRDTTSKIVEELCETSYLGDNQLIILFLVHHTNDESVIDDIIIRSLCTLEEVAPAKLTEEETARFTKIISSVPENVLSKSPVVDVRKHERDLRDQDERQSNGSDQLNDSPTNDFQLGVYRIFKSNEILGQILKNKFGILPKPKVEEVIETIADGGLRLVNSMLESEDQITHYASFFHKQWPDLDIGQIQLILRGFSFTWTMTNIEVVVGSINIPEIRDGIDSIVRRRSTPAYELVGYFSLLDSAEQLTTGIVNEVRRLLETNQDQFIKTVVSLRTQFYMNSHRSRAQVEQQMCSVLGIRYFHRKE